MTQPTSVNMTFDTSLVDLNTSFSTTESDPSDAGFPTTPPTQQTPTLAQDEQTQATPKLSQIVATAGQPPKSSTPVQHIPTQQAYDQWATVYDTDGNMLQSIDDLQLTTLLPQFLSLVLSDTTQTQAISLLDLGCGTGRNTSKLLSHSYPSSLSVTVTGLDFSSAMLSVAAQKLTSPTTSLSSSQPLLRLYCCDCFPTVANPTASPVPPAPELSPMNGVISTLVLEHIPLLAYFSTLASLVLPGGYALVTNMHKEMGEMSQAGFVNKQGVKVRGTSFAHSVQETIDQAEQSGFEVLEKTERKVEKEDVERGSVGERGWKWVGVNVWYGILLRKKA